jgi:hypothetical protein
MDRPRLLGVDVVDDALGMLDGVHFGEGEHALIKVQLGLHGCKR